MKIQMFDFLCNYKGGVTRGVVKNFSLPMSFKTPLIFAPICIMSKA